VPTARCILLKLEKEGMKNYNQQMQEHATASKQPANRRPTRNNLETAATLREYTKHDA